MADITIESTSPIGHRFNIAINGVEQSIVIPGINSLGVGYIGTPVATIKMDSEIFEAIKKKYSSLNILRFYSTSKPITTQTKGK